MIVYSGNLFNNNYDILLDFLIENLDIIKDLKENYLKIDTIFLNSLKHINNKYEEKNKLLKHFPEVKNKFYFSSNDIFVKDLKNNRIPHFYKKKITFEDFKYLQQFTQNKKIIIKILKEEVFYEIELKKYIKELFQIKNKDIIQKEFNYLYNFIGNHNDISDIINNYLNELKKDNIKDYFNLIIKNVDLLKPDITNKEFINFINNSNLHKSDLTNLFSIINYQYSEKNINIYY